MAEDVVADFPLECTSIKFYDWGEATIASPHRPPVFWTKCKIRQTSGKDMLIAHKMVESVISMCPHTAFLMLKCRVRQPPLRAGTFQQKQKAFIWGGRLLPREQAVQEAELCMLDSSLHQTDHSYVEMNKGRTRGQDLWWWWGIPPPMNQRSGE